jgi:hypothetical protein
MEERRRDVLGVLEVLNSLGDGAVVSPDRPTMPELDSDLAVLRW